MTFKSNSTVQGSAKARRLAGVSACAIALSLMAISASLAANTAHGDYTVIQATGIDIAAQSPLDMNKSMKLKKGQSLILLSPAGERVEVDGPYEGKPADHLVAVPDGDTTMGYDFTASDMHPHCTKTTSKPRPSGGPNPDETGGTQNQTSHC